MSRAKQGTNASESPCIAGFDRPNPAAADNITNKLGKAKMSLQNSKHFPLLKLETGKCNCSTYIPEKVLSATEKCKY